MRLKELCHVEGCLEDSDFVCCSCDAPVCWEHSNMDLVSGERGCAPVWSKPAGTFLCRKPRASAR